MNQLRNAEEISASLEPSRLTEPVSLTGHPEVPSHLDFAEAYLRRANMWVDHPMTLAIALR